MRRDEGKRRLRGMRMGFQGMKVVLELVLVAVVLRRMNRLGLEGVRRRIGVRWVMWVKLRWA